MGRPGGPVPVSQIPLTDNTNASRDLTTATLNAHNAKWNTLNFDAVPAYARGANSLTSQSQVQALNTLSKKLASRAARPIGGLLGDDSTVGSDLGSFASEKFYVLLLLLLPFVLTLPFLLSFLHPGLVLPLLL